MNPPDSYLPSKGCALLIPSGTLSNPDLKHLFAVVTNKCNGAQHLLVSISSVKPNRAFDSTCILEVGGHPFIDTQSFVFYAKPQQLGHAGIIRCVNGGLYIEKEDFHPSILKKICDGIAVSAMTPRWAKEYFRVNKDL